MKIDYDIIFLFIAIALAIGISLFINHEDLDDKYYDNIPYVRMKYLEDKINERR